MLENLGMQYFWDLEGTTVFFTPCIDIDVSCTTPYMIMNYDTSDMHALSSFKCRCWYRGFALVLLHATTNGSEALP